MSAEKRVCIDANIFVYAIDEDAGWRHKRAEEVVEQATQADCVLPIQVLAEFFRSATRKKLLAPNEARDEVRDWGTAFSFASPDKSTLYAAMDAVVEHNLSFWDAMIWAVARKAGCSAMITEDMQDKRTLGGITYINPFADDAEERLAALGLEVSKPK